MQTKLAKNPRTVRSFTTAFIGATTFLILFLILLVVNAVQVSSLVVLPFSRKAFRAINRACAGFWWGACVFESEKILGIEPIITGDTLPAGEKVIVFANHQEMPDIIAIMMLALRKNRIGDLKFFVKDILKYVPGIGWGMLFLDCLFVKRNWDSDAGKIDSIFGKFKRDNIPIWLVTFAEGTRITPKKLKLSQEFAAKGNLWMPETVLIPRTKGFGASIEGLRETIDAVYDVTIGYPTGIPTLWQFMTGQTKTVCMHVKRFPIASLPPDRAGLSTWLMKRFEEKNTLLKRFLETSAFA